MVEILLGPPVSSPNLGELFWRSVRHRTAKLGERVVDAAAERCCTGDDADGDKGSNQAIFDGSCAGFVFKETCEKSVHLIAYPVVVRGFVEPSST